MSENTNPPGRPECTFYFDEVFGGDVEIEVFPDALAAIQRWADAKANSQTESCDKLIEFKDDGSQGDAA